MAALDLVTQAALWRLIGAVLQSLPLTALVWLLCRFVHRLGPGARCWLWWLVSLQLLAGLVWPAPVRLPLLPAPAVAPTSLSVDAPPVRVHAALALHGEARVVVRADTATTAATPATAAGHEASGTSKALLRLFALAYLAGVAAMATRSLLDLRTTRRRLRACSADVPAAVLTRYQLLAARLSVRRVPPLRLCAQLDSPQLCGVWRPRLLLPATQLPRMSADAIDMALHHELVHLRRADLLWGWVPVLAQHLFFFHPLAHLAAREYALAREAACDAAVLADDRHAPQDYGRLLLQFGVAPRALAVVGAASPNFILLKRRLTMLQSRTTPWRAGAFALITAVAVLGVLPYRVVAAAPDSDPAKRANLAAAEPAVAAQPAARAAPAAQVQPAANAKPAAAKVQASAAATPATAPRAATSAVAGNDWMPAPPPPPVPPVPAVPGVPAPAVVPPPPPEPPLPAGAMRGTFSFVDKGDARTAWVLMEGDHVHAFGTPSDLRDARSQQHGEEALWWFRDGSKRYVVRDAATLAKLKQAYAPLQALSSQQSGLGEEQGELGRQQGLLGAEQGELGARQATIGARVAQLAAEQSTAAISGKPMPQERQQQAEREQQALARQMQALAAQQESLGTRQGALGRRQSDLGKRQEAALEQLRAQGERLAREAIASGKAQVL